MSIGLAGLGLVTVGFIATAFSPVLAGQYTVFVGAISGLCGLFMASNVAAQQVERKGATAQATAVVHAQASAGQTVTHPPSLAVLDP